MIVAIYSRLIAPAILLGCIFSQAVHAHHGWSLYQSDITLKGWVQKVDFGNPHDALVIEDEDGQAWVVLLAPPLRNRRMEFDESAVDINDALTLHGKRHYKEDVFEIKTERIERDGEEIYRYPGR